VLVLCRPSVDRRPDLIVEVLSSRVLLRPLDYERSVAFYRDALGLAIFREFGAGTVFFMGIGFLEISGQAENAPGPNIRLWMQVRDVDATHVELAERGVPILREPVTEPWGLREMWIADPDGVSIAIIQVPDDHPLRSRGLS
jgi:predicted enzyme related to lactoylglutathione lyase